MNTYLLSALGLLGFYIVYFIVSGVVKSRYHARRASELGCKKPFQRQYKWPLGVDMVWDIMKADKEQIVPNFMLDLYHRQGDINTWEQNFLGSPNFVTVDPKNIQALLATQFNDFCLGDVRRDNFFPLLGNGIFTSDGKNWEHSRALLRPQFARDQISDLELEELHFQDMLKHLTAKNDWTAPTDLTPLFFRLTLDSATQFLFGESVHSQTAALNDKETKGSTQGESKLDWTGFAPAFDGATMTLGVRGRLSEMYWLYNPSSFRTECRRVHEFADYYVNLALNTDLSTLQADESEKGTAKHEKYIFLAELVKKTRDPIELRSQLLNILLAGRDTTAGLLGWTVYTLARKPEEYQKLRNVILEHFGPYAAPKDITFASLKACAPLQHVLSEILRLFATVPLNSRRATKDTTLPCGGGPDGRSPVYVKKGQEVNYAVHVMHRRHDIWGADADEFRPGRWVGRKVGWEFLPFNGGPRICLGQQFALTEAGYVLVRLLQRFDDIENLDDEVVVKHQYSLTTAPAKCLVRLHEAKD